MKTSVINLLYFFLLFLLIRCTADNSNISEEPNKISSERLVSTSFKAPAFEKDDRVEKIKSIAPRLHELMVQHAENRNIPGVAYGVLVDNELVIASAAGLINLDEKFAASTKSSFRIASMTKSFVAMAVMKLRDDGMLSLSDPVSQYIPEMSQVKYLTEDSPLIDIEDLLNMTTGLPEDNPWGDRQLDESNQMLMDLITNNLSFSNIPSYQYEYSNTGYALLGNLVTQVSGMPYQEYITSNILEPLGMGNTYWEYGNIPNNHLAIGYRWEDEKWKLEPMLHDGSFGAIGGLITSIEDFSKYVSFQLSAWPPRNDENNGPIKRSSLREMQAPQFSKLNANATDYDGEPCPSISGYGYGLRISEDCNDIKQVGHGGALPGFGSNYQFYPEYGVGVMAFGNLTYTRPYPLSAITKLLFDSLNLQPRKLPVSDILVERQNQLVEWIQSADTELESKILAENLYLDKSREKRIAEIKDILNNAGIIQKIYEVEPRNQLRGSFKIEAENGFIDIFFTLTPEEYPKVQRLNITYDSN